MIRLIRVTFVWSRHDTGRRRRWRWNFQSSSRTFFDFLESPSHSFPSSSSSFSLPFSRRVSLVAFDSTTASNLQWRRYKERNVRCEIKSYSGFHWEIIIIFGHIQVSSSISNHHSHSSGRTLIQRLRLRWQWNHNEYEMILIYNGILATSYQDIIEYTNEGYSRD